MRMRRYSVRVSKRDDWLGSRRALVNLDARYGPLCLRDTGVPPAGYHTVRPRPAKQIKSPPGREAGFS